MLFSLQAVVKKRTGMTQIMTSYGIFNMLCGTYSEFYNPSKHLAIDAVIVLFRGRVVFKQYIPKKYKWFGIKIFKLCDVTGYTFDKKFT
jgi:hypothetical protein